MRRSTMSDQQTSKQPPEWLFLAAMITISSILLFTNLGNRVITGDEAYTLLQAKTVLQHGYPYPFYNNIELLPKATYYLGYIPIFNWTPWIESYLAAAMLGMVGLKEFWLRFPFALLSLGTIILFYFFMRKLSAERFIINTATILLTTSITFLLHARQARWYALAAFFALATWYTYWLWLRENKPVGFFIGASILLFHSMLFIFFAVAFSLLVHFLIFERKTKSIRQLIIPAISITILTAPWFIFTGQLAKSGGTTPNPVRLALNTGMYSYYTAILLVPLVLFIPLAIQFIKNRIISPESKFVMTIGVASFLFLTIKADLLPAVRYLVFLIPLFSSANAHALDWFRKRSSILGTVLLVLVIMTNMINIAPFLPIKPFLKNINLGRSDTEVQGFITDSLASQSYMKEYISEITHDVKGTDDEIIQVLQEQGTPSQYFATSAFTHTIMVYTDMNVSLPDLRAEAYNTRFGNQTNKAPAWIIPRGFELKKEENKEFLKEVDKRYNLSLYTPITISISDNEQWASAPDPINHKFKTDRNGTLTIYKKK